MRRENAIQNIMNQVTDEIVVTSAGKISRETYAIKDRPRNFYVQGSMGASLGIGIGLALSKPDMVVVVIAGDGEILMNLDTLVLLNKLQKEDKVKNLKLFILDNNEYQSTGGQKTCSDAIDFRLLCDCKVIFVKRGGSDVPRIGISHKKIKERFMDAIK